MVIWVIKFSSGGYKIGKIFQNALIGESVVVGNASHFVKLKTYKYVA